MDQLLVNFWWSGSASSSKIHWLPAAELRKPVTDGGLGFRSFFEFNLAFIAKLAWKIIINPNALWTQLLKGLYFPNTSFLQASRHHKSSWIWSGIIEGRKSLILGLRKNIGDGNDTSIVDAWIPESAGFKASCSEAFMKFKVSDFILNPHRKWDLQKLKAAFPADVVEQILLIPLGPEGFPDKFVWHFESTGKFTVRSCYRYLQSITHPQNQPVDVSLKKLWKWLWHLDLPPKLKFFLWRACKNALPTKASLFRRRCSDSAVCVTCLAEVETLEHLLFHCAVSRSFWQLVSPAIQCPNINQSTISWFMSIAASASKDSSAEIGYIVWYIWKLRNELLFQNVSPSLLDLASRRMNDLQRWRTCSSNLSTIRSVSSSLSSPLTISLAPAAYVYKVVCDGAFKASIQKGAYSVIQYNIEGHVVNGKAGVFNCAAPICAEAKAVQVAVDLMKNISATSVVYTDNLILANAISGDQEMWPWQASGFLASITRLLYWNQQIKVCYLPRSSIQAAHLIAVKARDGTLPADWLSSL
ncbi:Putative ribonuclease H protein At1g65750 [Linum perenne]